MPSRAAQSLRRAWSPRSHLAFAAAKTSVAADLELAAVRGPRSPSLGKVYRRRVSEFIPVRIAVMTISDTRTLDDDRSGALLIERLESAGHQLVDRALVR